MCPRGCWQEPVARPRVLFVSPWARFAARSSDRSVARSMGRLAVSLLSPAAPEASACSAAGIHWALEDLVASCLHHRQWYEVQARSKLVHACLSALARPGRLLPACSCPSRPPPACLPAPHEVGVCHRLCPVSFHDFVCLFGFARLLVPAPSRLQAASYLPTPARLLHTKSVFVAGYALCHFPTLCDFPRPRPRPSTHAVRGPVSRPPLYPLYGPDVTACRTRSPKLRCLPVPSGAVACSTGS